MDTKPDTKITLYDAENQRIGETFSRRARQLVKQQRALWTDDTHTAIRFIPDAPEEWEISEMSAERITEAPPVKTEGPKEKPMDEAAIYMMARTRIGSRRKMFWHTLALFPSYLFVFILADGWFRQAFESGMVFGAGVTLVTMLYIGTVRNYLKYNRGYFQYANLEGRQARKLEAEIEHLKRMGYRG